MMIQVQIGKLANLFPGHLTEKGVYKAIVRQVVLRIAIDQADELPALVVEVDVRVGHPRFRDSRTVLAELGRLQDFF